VYAHLKRDKQGKLYWFSREYEDKKLVGKLDLIGEKFSGLDQRMARIEILELIAHHPMSKSTILGKYDAYHKKGWNSYIDDVINEWKKTACEA
jgi:hypothetical protein